MVFFMIPFSVLLTGATGTQNIDSPIELDETKYNTLYSVNFREITDASKLSDAGWVLTPADGVTPNADTFKYGTDGLSYATQKNVNFTCGAVAFNAKDCYVVDYTFKIAESPRVVYMHFNATDTDVYTGSTSNSNRWIFRGTDGKMAWDSSKFYDSTYTNCLSSNSTGNLAEVSSAAATAVLTDRVDIRIRVFVIRGESKYAVIDVPNVGQYYVLDVANPVADGSYFSFSSCDNYTDERRLLLKDFSIHTYTPPTLIAPTEIKYELDNSKSGHAAGKITLKLAENHNTQKLVLYWGDANGRLDGYNAYIGSVAVSEKGATEVVYNMPNGLIIPPGATKLLVYPHGNNGEADVFASTDLPSGSAYVMPTKAPISEFYVISDTHWGRNATCEAQTMTTLEYIAETNPDADGIFIVGDMINGGELLNGGTTEKAQYASFYEAWHSIADLPDIYPVVGNHEAFGWYKNGSCDNNGYIDAFVDNLFDYYEHIELDENWDKPYYDVTVGGSYFIVLGVTTVVSSNGGYLGDEQIEWLEEKLAAAPADKPVFIMIHQPLAATVAENTNTGEDITHLLDSVKVKEILDKYPNAVVFNGHTHYSFQWESVNHMWGGGDKYVAFNDSSVRDNVTGYCVSVYNDRTLVRGVDFETGEWIAAAQFVVNEREVADEGGDTTPPTANDGASSTTAPAATDAIDGTTAEAVEEKGGCGSTLSGAGVALTALMGAAIITFKKRRLFES